MKETDCALLAPFSTVPRIFITIRPGFPEGCAWKLKYLVLETDVPEGILDIFLQPQRTAAESAGPIRPGTRTEILPLLKDALQIPGYTADRAQ